MPHIASIQIGKIRTEGDPTSREVTSRQWTSAFDKRPSSKPVTISELGIDGDEVADTQHHGGPDKAILCYPLAHYELWSQSHPHLELGPGGFGENLTLGDVNETTVCIGDQFSTTHCLFEVSQPRQPCWKISRRWGDKTLTKEVAQTGRTGWYLRVLNPGQISPGDGFELVARPNEQWSIARANDVMFGREVDRLAVFELMNLSQLADAWKKDLA